MLFNLDSKWCVAGPISVPRALADSIIQHSSCGSVVRHIIYLMQNPDTPYIAMADYYMITCNVLATLLLIFHDSGYTGFES